MTIFNYIEKYGLKETWNSLIYNFTNFDIEHNPNISDNIFKDKTFYEISDLYEESLAFNDKINKKKNGQYYTPEDVSKLMAKQVNDFDDGVWCDPCCGIGNLSYELLLLKPEKLSTMQFFDIDDVSLTICRYLLSYFFGLNPESIKNNFHNKSFLENNDVHYDYVIMNPPYNGKEKGEDLYISFMKKAAESNGFISITPQSFTNSLSTPAVELKSKIDNFSFSKIYCFDNIPDCIFCGKKKGIFNTNTSNSVRAAITVCRNNESGKFITPLLRWKSEERKTLFDNIDNFLSERGFLILYFKWFKGTEKFHLQKRIQLGDLLSKEKTEYVLYVPSTPRYFITASKRFLKRSSYFELYFRTERDMNIAYMYINSSLCYWWWRVLDGGMTLSKSTITSLRIDDIPLNEEIIKKLEAEEETNLVIKMNAGKANENIKHSKETLDELDEYLGVKELSFTKNNSYVNI